MSYSRLSFLGILSLVTLQSMPIPNLSFNIAQRYSTMIERWSAMIAAPKSGDFWTNPSNDKTFPILNISGERISEHSLPTLKWSDLPTISNCVGFYPSPNPPNHPQLRSKVNWVGHPSDFFPWNLWSTQDNSVFGSFETPPLWVSRLHLSVIKSYRLLI